MANRRLALTLLAATLAAGSLAAASRQADGASEPAATARLMSMRRELGLDQLHSFKVGAVKEDELGQTHVFARQFYQGVRVWGGDLITHADKSGRALPHTDALVRDIGLNVVPGLSAKEALGIVHADLNPRGAYAYEPTTELVVYPEHALVPRRNVRNPENADHFENQVLRHTLAYHVHVQLENGAEETIHRDYLINAHTGAVIASWDDLHTTGATGTGNSQFSGTVSLNTNLNGSSYELNDVVGNMPIKTYNLNHATSGIGTLYSSTSNTWGDGANYSGGSTTSANGQTAAVDAHFGIMATSAFYKNVFNRNGIDNTGKATYSRVHYSTSYDNAFWDDTCFCMTYGDGSSFKSLESLDVAGHEMSHGVCANNGLGGLTYSGESGGINEADSDIMGTFVVFYTYGGGGTGTTVANSIPTASLHGYTPWTIGSQLSATPLRYMYKPSLDGRSPDAWSSTVGTLDVHYSSGPANRMIYFLSQGATTSGNTSTTYLPSGMTGIGNDHAARIWYRALTTYFNSSLTYAQCRTACMNAASDLYGTGSAEYAAVQNAFHGINVGAAAPTGVAVSISPTTASIKTNATFQFTASVTGSTNTAVTWTATGGTVSSSGLYTAPATAGTYTVKATSAADTTKSASATVTVTSSGTTTELISNGGFESGTTPWAGTTGDIGAWTKEPAHSGTRCAWLMGNGVTASENLTQSITIPSTVTSATLTFWLHIDTAETTTTTAYDTLKVQVINGTTTTTLVTYSNLNKNTGYTQKTFDLSAYKGKTVTLKFLGAEDSSLQTSFVIDDVSVKTN